MTRVLFLALEFPPLNNTGVHRSAKLAKYLAGYGVEPIVVTMRGEDATQAFGAPLEPALLAELPADLPIVSLEADMERQATSRLGHFLRVWGRVDDPHAKRVTTSLSRALPGLVSNHKPELVYTSLPPFSAGPLAASIARRLDVPLVVDMRDGWSHWCAGAFPTYAHWALVLRRERRLFEQAAAVITVTEPLANQFRRSHPHIPASRFQVIPNGYDGELAFPEVIKVESSSTDAEYTIGYVGRFYYSPEARRSAQTAWWRRRGHRKLHYQPVSEDWLYRSPHFLFRTMAELRRRSPALGKRIRFVLVGDEPPWLSEMAAEHGLQDAVRCMGRVANAEVPALVRSFDAQLCTSVKVHGGDDYALASKTFDYVKSGRPIFGLVTRGAQRDFLTRSGMAVLADPDDLDASVKALTKLVQGGFSLTPDKSFLATFHRSAIAERMAAVMRAAVHDRNLSPADNNTLGRP